MSEPFTLELWKDRVAAWWRETARDLLGTMARLGVRTAYGLLTASAWLPLLEASGEPASPALGVLAGLSLEDLRERFERRARQWEEDPSDLVPPEGEPILDARKRLITAVASIVRRRPAVVGLVCHDLAAGLVRSALAGESGGNPRRWMEGRPRVELWVLPPDAAGRLDELQVALASGED